ncbi:MAG: AAA family ATPase [Syntrophaceae bacterium]|nr:AAA family ATPase [Syntrophaceae bacterium]
MDYFEILNLKREPFSNSPEPDFFFHAPQHITCLQKLELSIRLQRGLSVVVGDVGTGKTTLCRQLIIRLGTSNEDRQNIETHVIMDPGFNDALEFLSMVAMTFGISPPDSEASEWQIKENIKKHLLKKGVDEKKIVVLIVDEGQKLPAFCLEVMREFLNYETNEHKLLQTVIFAQEEFISLLKHHANFADRVNEYYHLRNLNFRQTRAMIKYRISKAAEEDRPFLFTNAGFLAVYGFTKGYPRKIINLCHKIMLELIIQNRSRADFFLVLSCAKRLNFERRGKIRWVAATVAAMFLLISILSMQTIKNDANDMKVLDARKHLAPVDDMHESLPIVHANSTVVEEARKQKNKMLPSFKKKYPEIKMMDVKVVGNIESKQYYLPGMQQYNKVEAYHRTEFATEKEALLAGYKRYVK